MEIGRPGPVGVCVCGWEATGNGVKWVLLEKVEQVPGIEVDVWEKSPVTSVGPVL